MHKLQPKAERKQRITRVIIYYLYVIRVSRQAYTMVQKASYQVLVITSSNIGRFKKNLAHFTEKQTLKIKLVATAPCEMLISV